MLSSKSIVTRVFTIIGGSSLLCLGVALAQQSGKELTFNRDIAPILEKNCAGCHRPNDMAPFSVLSYKDVQPWIPLLREQVKTRQMPPWHADSRFGDFSNNLQLAQKDIDAIVTWVDQGAKEGDKKDLASVPGDTRGWSIGKPDQILMMSEDYVIEPGAPDTYVYVTFRVRFSEDRWIQAAEILPGNRHVVHHVIAHVLPPQPSAGFQDIGGEAIDQAAMSMFYKQGSLTRVKMDAPVIDDGANVPNGGAVYPPRPAGEDSGQFSSLLAAYAPGKGPDVYPAGMAKRVRAGSIIILQIHYSSFHGALHSAERDRTSLGLVFARQPPEKRVVTLTIPNHFFKIPAGAASHQVTAAYTFTRDVQLIDYMPHMHLRGKDMKYEVIYPNGKRETLLWVPRFNFNWQIVYRLREPIKIPRGTRMIITAHFDNSSRNKYNPDQTKAVRWGDPTYDEMMIAWLDYVVPNSDAPEKADPK
jgi:hypothetical protein